jgi:hypothetical protein
LKRKEIFLKKWMETRKEEEQCWLKYIKKQIWLIYQKVKSNLNKEKFLMFWILRRRKNNATIDFCLWKENKTHFWTILFWKNMNTMTVLSKRRTLLFMEFSKNDNSNFERSNSWWRNVSFLTYNQLNLHY